jgi:hypothetical protein
MSSTLVYVKTGLDFSLIFVPKLVLVALGLPSANAVALYLPYLAWRIWFSKQKPRHASCTGKFGRVAKEVQT